MAKELKNAAMRELSYWIMKYIINLSYLNHLVSIQV